MTHKLWVQTAGQTSLTVKLWRIRPSLSWKPVKSGASSRWLSFLCCPMWKSDDRQDAFHFKGCPTRFHFKFPVVLGRLRGPESGLLKSRWSKPARFKVFVIWFWSGAFARWWSFCNIPLIIVISLTVFIFQVYGHWGGDYDAFVLLSPSQLRELEGVQRSKSNHHPLFLFLFGSYSAHCSTTNLHSQRYRENTADI